MTSAPRRIRTFDLPLRRRSVIACERWSYDASSPLHLHKCLPGTYTDILTAVPSRAGECRFVRVTSVLIFARAPACVAFVLAPTPDGQGHPPAAGSRQDLRCAPRGSGIRPAAIDAPMPDGGTPPQRSAPADPPTPDHTHAWEGPPRAPGETLHHASTLARPRAATHAVPTTHHPAGDSNPLRPEARLHTAKRNACSASQSHTERRFGSQGDHSSATYYRAQIIHSCALSVTAKYESRRPDSDTNSGKGQQPPRHHRPQPDRPPTNRANGSETAPTP